jgi:hypothetical protein
MRGPPGPPVSYPPEDEPVTAVALMFLALMVACVLVAMAVLMTGCSPSHWPKEPLPMAIVLPIPHEKPKCFIRDLPGPPPSVLTMDYDEKRVVERVFVHIRDYQAFQQWAIDEHEWSVNVAECLKQITEGP